MIGRRTLNHVAGRPLACFAAAFFFFLLGFCLRLCAESWISNLVFCAALAICLFITAAAGIKMGAAVAAAALLVSGALFFLKAVPVYLGSKAATAETNFRLEAADYSEIKDGYITLDSVIREGEYRGLKVYAVIYDTELSFCPGDCFSLDGSASAERNEYTVSNGAQSRFLTVFSHDAPYDIERAKGFSLRYAPIRFSHFLREKIYSFIGGDEGGLIAALLTGNKDGISNIFKKALSLSGTSHITAVSGMHVGFIAALALMLLGKRWGMAVSGPLMIIFGLTTGMAAPVRRAIIMWVVLLLGFIFKRENDAITSLSAALVAILVFDPFASMSVSLQLSFSAVYGLLTLSAGINRTLWSLLPLSVSKNRITDYCIKGLSASAAASLSTFPVLMIFFDRVSVVSPLANLAVLWLVPLLMALGAVCLVICFAGLPARLISDFTLKPLASLFIFIVKGFARSRCSSFSSGSIFAAFAVMAAGMFLVLGWKIAPLKRRAAALVLAGAACLSALCLLPGDRCAVTDDGLLVFLHSGKLFAVSECFDKRLYETLCEKAYEWGYFEVDAAVSTLGCDTGRPEGIKRIYTPAFLSTEGEDVTFSDGGKTFDVSGVTFTLYSRGNSSAMCFADAGGKILIYACGGVDRAIEEKAECDIMVADGATVSDVYKMRRLFENIVPEKTVFCGLDTNEQRMVERMHKGRNVFVPDGETAYIELGG